MQLIKSVTVGAGGASSIVFNNIPQTFTDLIFLYSLRNDQAVAEKTAYLILNGSFSSYSNRRLLGNGSSASSASSSTNEYIIAAQGTSTTLNTFTSGQIYFPNYRSGAFKSYMNEVVYENNGTTAWQVLQSGLWSNSSAITEVNLALGNGNFVQNSTMSMYGIVKSSNSLSFDFNGGVEGFTTANATATASGGILTWTATAGDPNLTTPSFAIHGSNARYIKITWKRSVVAQSGTWAGQIFYSIPGRGYSESFTKFITQPTWTNDYKTTVIDMGVLSAGGYDYITNTINQIRFDFTNGTEAASYLIDKIEFSPTA
jgi:hypothetical protein